MKNTIGKVRVSFNKGPRGMWFWSAAVRVNGKMVRRHGNWNQREQNPMGDGWWVYHDGKPTSRETQAGRRAIDNYLWTQAYLQPKCQCGVRKNADGHGQAHVNYFREILEQM